MVRMRPCYNPVSVTNVRSLRQSFTLITLLLLGVSALRAQDGAEGVLSHLRRTSPVAGPISPFSNPKIAIADFDGDDKPDGAVLLESNPFLGSGNFQLELHLTSHKNANINFQSRELDISVAAIDIDHDGDVDIVVQQSVTHKGLQVWINDGHGNFEKGRIEDFPSVLTPTRDQLMSSERRDFPAVSFPSQRGFETMLMASHVAGRPPSSSSIAVCPTDIYQLDRPFSLAPSRAPPIS
jgi:hypothetical protein